MATVKITNLHKSYGSVEVLKGINLLLKMEVFWFWSALQAAASQPSLILLLA